ncbi:hypothetical protein [Streptomyces sp. NPDC052225]|uniref:hypothetical protein n=1 Tax=Streptomyces sp. NPDC052225 TaxID=3154949 RepID=UPI003447C691
MTSPLISTPRRWFAIFGTVAGLCLFAWWAVQPVSGDCPDEGLTLSSDPYGSTYDPADAKGGFQYQDQHVPLEGPAPSPEASTDAASIPGAAAEAGDHEPCGAETSHPRLYGWLGL